MSGLTIGSLFSGIGGLELGLLALQLPVLGARVCSSRSLQRLRPSVGELGKLATYPP